MNSREKKIFFAGVSVGTQLKGWASAGTAGGGGADGASTHVYGNVVKMQPQGILVIRDFSRNAEFAVVLKAPTIIPVDTYEGSE